MVLLGVSHPPAGATTLIISLGITSKPRELVIIESGGVPPRCSGFDDQPARGTILILFGPARRQPNLPRVIWNRIPPH